MNSDWKSRYEIALEATRKAGQIALSYFDASVIVEWKHDQSPVTVADRKAEQSLRSTIQAHFPHDGFLGEEFGDTPGSSGYRWIMDPIDGTRSFVRGIPLWGTLVGLEYRGEMVAGIAAAPALGQTWHALRGNGAFRDQQKIHVSNEHDLKRSLIFYSGLNYFVEAGKADVILNLIRQTDRQRGFGDFYGFMLVAQGSGEAMIDYGVHAWDVAALIPIVEEAGGRMTTWSGKQDLSAPDSVATNPQTYQAICSLLTAD